MTTLTAQQIACVYAWLAQLFSRELDDEQLTQIASAQMAEWFSLLKSEPPLTAAVNELENRIATLTVRDDARLELAADFCGLFLMTDKQAALPYASAYKQDEQEIKRLLVEGWKPAAISTNRQIIWRSISNCSAICIFRWERGPFLREESTVCGKKH